MTTANDYLEARRSTARHPLGFRPRFRSTTWHATDGAVTLTPNAYPARSASPRMLTPAEAAAEAAAPAGAVVQLEELDR